MYKSPVKKTRNCFSFHSTNNSTTFNKCSTFLLFCPSFCSAFRIYFFVFNKLFSLFNYTLFYVLGIKLYTHTHAKAVWPLLSLSTRWLGLCFYSFVSCFHVYVYTSPFPDDRTSSEEEWKRRFPHDKRRDIPSSCFILWKIVSKAINNNSD